MWGFGLLLVFGVGLHTFFWRVLLLVYFSDVEIEVYVGGDLFMSIFYVEVELVLKRSFGV